MKQYITDYSEMNVTIDCSNGMAGLLIRDILAIPQNFCTKISTERFQTTPNPARFKNVVDLQKAVKENKSDLGIIFDGDGDRVMFVDENSRFVSPDLMIALLGHYFWRSEAKKGTLFRIFVHQRLLGVSLPMGGKMHIMACWSRLCCS